MESKDKEIFYQGYRQPITNNKPARLLTLNNFIRYTLEPPRLIIEIFEKIAAADLAGDQKEKARLKQTYLYYFTPCVIVNPIRNYASIKSFTGLLVLDFDHLDNAEDFKTFLFSEYKVIIAAWLSPSKRGVKALVKIPIVQTVDDFKQYYFGIAAEMVQYAGFDPSGQNCVLPLFQSYDPDLLYREDPDTWSTKGTKRNDFTQKPVTPRPYFTPTDQDKQTVVRMIHAGFSNITNTGHPVLRSLCISVGGYVASGYLDEYEAMQVIYWEIENHSYLQKGIAGYKRTAQWAVNIGKNKPLSLNFRNG